MKKFFKVLKARLVCVWRLLTSSTFIVVYIDKTSLNAYGYYPTYWKGDLQSCLDDLGLETKRRHSDEKADKKMD